MKLIKKLWNKIRGNKNIKIKGTIYDSLVNNEQIIDEIFEKNVFLTYYGYDQNKKSYKVLINYYDGNKKH